MTPEYSSSSFRLYALHASPWKVIFYLITSAAFVAGGYLIGFRSGARPDAFTLFMAGLTIFLFGLGGVIFGAQFIVEVIARRPLAQFTEEGLRCRTSFLRARETRLSWSQIARITVYYQKTGRSSMSYLSIIPRSLAFYQALASGASFAALSTLRGLGGALIPLNSVYLRATPARCEQLLQELQTACASEIARYGVSVEPNVVRLRML